MTAAKLKELVLALGPIVDEAIRASALVRGNATEFLHLEQQRDAGEIDRAAFDAAVARMLGGLTHAQRLAFRIALARHRGHIPGDDAPDSHRPDTDWRGLVEAGGAQ